MGTVRIAVWHWRPRVDVVSCQEQAPLDVLTVGARETAAGWCMAVEREADGAVLARFAACDDMAVMTEADYMAWLGDPWRGGIARIDVDGSALFEATPEEADEQGEDVFSDEDLAEIF